MDAREESLLKEKVKESERERIEKTAQRITNIMIMWLEIPALLKYLQLLDVTIREIPNSFS